MRENSSSKTFKKQFIETGEIGKQDGQMDLREGKKFQKLKKMQ